MNIYLVSISSSKVSYGTVLKVVASSEEDAKDKAIGVSFMYDPLVHDIFEVTRLEEDASTH